jgi:hypothetical protein
MQNFDSYFSDPDIDGVALQEAWQIAEPTEGNYVWTEPNNALDGVIAAAQAAGKRVTLHLIAEPAGAPTWLASDGAQYYSGTDSRGNRQSFVVPWDPVYLAKYTTFIQALSNHIESKGYTTTIFDVSIVVPELEMNIYSCANGQLSSAIAYDRTAYLNAWEQIAGVIQAAFPDQKKFVSAPAAQAICGTTQDPSFYPDLLTALLTTSNAFWMFGADLNAASSNGPAGSGRVAPYLSTFTGKTGIGFQMLGSATSGTPSLSGTYPGNLQQAVCAGLAIGGQYIEIYRTDELNTDSTIRSAIKAIHNPGLCN